MRENTRIHPPVFIGLDAKIGANCKIQAFAYIPDNVVIGNNVFIGPGVVFTNDKYPPSNGKWKDDPPTIVRDHASIGANATILPGVVIGERAKIGAGAVVTKNVRAGATVAGNPAKEILTERNNNNLEKIFSPGSMSCGHECHYTEKYGFVPEAGCPEHD